MKFLSLKGNFNKINNDTFTTIRTKDKGISRDELVEINLYDNDGTFIGDLYVK